MARSFVIHLGIHKTATTSLQQFFAGNQKQLRSVGVEFTPLNHMRNNVTPLIRSMTKHERTYLAQIVDSTTSPTIFWSDETILGWTHDVKAGALYPYARSRAHRLCDEYPNADFQFVLTLRSPSRYLASMYCEYIKHNPFESFDEYVSGFDIEAFSYKDLFFWLYELPQNATTIVIPFEEKYGGGVDKVAQEVIRLSCEHSPNIDTSGVTSMRARVSFSHEEINLAQHIAAQAGPLAAKHFLQIIENNKLRFGTTRFDPLPRPVASALEEVYLKDLSYFAVSQTSKVSLNSSAARLFDASNQSSAQDDDHEVVA